MNTRSPCPDIEVPRISRPRFVWSGPAAARRAGPAAPAENRSRYRETGADPGAVTADVTDIAGGGPDGSVKPMDYVFHELHADGRHALCAVCGS
jgi:hypothetical protein